MLNIDPINNLITHVRYGKETGQSEEVHDNKIVCSRYVSLSLTAGPSYQQNRRTNW